MGKATVFRWRLAVNVGIRGQHYKDIEAGPSLYDAHKDMSSCLPIKHNDRIKFRLLQLYIRWKVHVRTHTQTQTQRLLSVYKNNSGPFWLGSYLPLPRFGTPCADIFGPIWKLGAVTRETKLNSLQGRHWFCPTVTKNRHEMFTDLEQCCLTGEGENTLKKLTRSISKKRKKEKGTSLREREIGHRAVMVLGTMLPAFSLSHTPRTHALTPRGHSP